MWKTKIILSMLCIAAVSSTESRAISLELLGTIGFPVEVPGEDRENSFGGVGAVIFGQPGRVVMGGGVGYDKFDNKDDEGSVAFSTLFLDIRVPIVYRGRFGLFGVVAPEYAIRKTTYSKQTQASNPLIPSSESDGNFGLAIGTGFSFTLAGDWLRLVSTQKVHFISTEVDGTAFFAISLGLSLSN
jgi:hypothetical protein